MKLNVVTIYVVLSLATIVTLVVLLSRKNKSEHFSKCICSGARGRVCQDTEKVEQDYNNGLTEFSDFAEMQKKLGGPKWGTVSPGDYDYPSSEGCPWTDKVTCTGMSAWDNSSFDLQV